MVKFKHQDASRGAKYRPLDQTSFSSRLSLGSSTGRLLIANSFRVGSDAVPRPLDAADCPPCPAELPAAEDRALLIMPETDRFKFDACRSNGQRESRKEDPSTLLIVSGSDLQLKAVDTTVRSLH
jgi:hypothetical protein